MASKSKSSSLRSASNKTSSSTNRNRKPFEPTCLYPVPTALLKGARPSIRPPAAPAAVPPLPTAPVTKKPSKWKLSFGKNSTSTLASAATSALAGRVSPVEELSPGPVDFAQPMSAIASNVTTLIMGLDAPANSRFHAVTSDIPLNAAEDTSSTWSRGCRGRESQESLNSHQSRMSGFTVSTSPAPVSPQEPWGGYVDKRATSPNSTRSSIRPGGSSASSVISSNWRSSMSSTATSSSAGTSTSAFTRYSNSSARSVSTTATSVSSGSWRTSVKPASTYSQGNIPKNIKIMDGIPWELHELPRGQFPNPVGDIFGSPPVRKQRTRKSPKDLKLDTITERPTGPKSPEHVRRDAATSTTDLGNVDADGVKKVQKGQINTLAKMLSALRR